VREVQDDVDGLALAEIESEVNKEQVAIQIRLILLNDERRRFLTRFVFIWRLADEICKFG